MDSFDKSKLMVFPRNVLVGHGVLDQVGELARTLELDGGVTLVTGDMTRTIAGERVMDLLKKAGYVVTMHTIREPTLAEVDAALSTARRSGSRFLVGVGGGSVIDVTKLAAKRLGHPFLSVPTSASHDGITSPRASIRDGRGTASIDATAPLGILADTAIITKAPYRTLASGCADAISNLSAVKDWKLAHRLKNEEYSSFAAALSQTAAEMIIENADAIKPGLETASWLVVKSLIVSGVSMSVAGSSRPASGAEHMISHTLDRLSAQPAMHGEQVGVATILALNLHGGEWERVREALRKIGGPTTAAELGVSRETMVVALTSAHRIRPERYTILGESGLTEAAAERVLRVTGVA
ncbi:MAG: NAD(P)-dependent glycerol-1-phosphate dehydrogenase [Euryarchaeota archaeon]|nr:NAD(P)-dependent glycerol-1-phosphate dehydrogenase [Euryarchaeota archaeon]